MYLGTYREVLEGKDAGKRRWGEYLVGLLNEGSVRERQQQIVNVGGS